jgi:hypothetical protein
MDGISSDVFGIFLIFEIIIVFTNYFDAEITQRVHRRRSVYYEYRHVLLAF